MKLSIIFRERDSTKGSIIKNILIMTLPLWINSGFWIIFSGLNIFWVSQLGPQALAAVIAGSTGFMLMMTPVQGLVTAIYGLIGEKAGSQDKQGLEKLAKEILLVGFLLTLFIVVSGYFLAPVLLGLLETEPEVFSLATTYLRIQIVGGLITFFLWIINGMVRATGDMTKPMCAVILMIALNIIFDWLLILGNCGFPRLGVAGAALSSVISAGTGALCGFLILIRGYSPIKINFKQWRDFRIRSSTVKEIFRIASFDTLEVSSKAFIDLILLRLIAIWGTAALAAYSIGQRLARMSAMPGWDLAMTTAIIMSNNLGANQTKRAEKSSWDSAKLNALIMGSVGLIFFVFAGDIMAIFSQDPQVIDVGIKYLHLTTPAYVFFAVGVILRRAFGGAKNTRIPALTTLLIFGGLQLGLAWYLPGILGLGASGIWLAILIANTLNGLTLAILFKMGFWKQSGNNKGCAQ